MSHSHTVGLLLNLGADFLGPWPAASGAIKPHIYLRILMFLRKTLFATIRASEVEKAVKMSSQIGLNTS